MSEMSVSVLLDTTGPTIRQPWQTIEPNVPFPTRCVPTLGHETNQRGTRGVTRDLRRHNRRNEGGASAVEFALVLPVLIMLVFGAIQYGLYFWSMQGGSSAVREAARRGAVADLVTCNEFRTYVKDRLGATATNVVDTDIKRTYTTVSGTPVTDKNLVAVGDVVTVQVEFTAYDLHLPLIPDIGGGRVSQLADARVEEIPALTPKPEICS